MKRVGYITAFIAFLLIFLSLSFGCSRKEAKNIKITKENNPPVSTSEKTEEVSATENNNTTEIVSKTIETQTASTTFGTKNSTIKSESKSGKDIKETNPSVYNSFFDDAVFVGDSVTLGLRNFVTSERNKGNECLGNAKFLTAGSMGYTNTLPQLGAKNSIHPRYMGREMYIEDAIALIKAKKVFIMLGMNDFCIYPTEEAIDNANKCINRIKGKNPGIKIYIESVTPALFDRGSFSNANIDKFNAAMKTLCEKNGYTYVDIASVMKDANGILISSYCGDAGAQGVHMSNEGCRAWVNYLKKTFVEEKYK